MARQVQLLSSLRLTWLLPAKPSSATEKRCDFGYLLRRTRVLVTNQLQFTKEADLIVYIADGKVEESGTYAELMAADAGYAKLMNQAEVGQRMGPPHDAWHCTCRHGPFADAVLACCKPP